VQDGAPEEGAGKEGVSLMTDVPAKEGVPMKVAKEGAPGAHAAATYNLRPRNAVATNNFRQTFDTTHDGKSYIPPPQPLQCGSNAPQQLGEIGKMISAHIMNQMTENAANKKARKSGQRSFDE
jgi:hypothetical protein